MVSYCDVPIGCYLLVSGLEKEFEIYTFLVRIKSNSIQQWEIHFVGKKHVGQMVLQNENVMFGTGTLLIVKVMFSHILR